MSTETALQGVRDAIVEFRSKNNKEEADDADKGLGLMERNTMPMTSNNLKEVEILRRIWSEIEGE
eukprot:23999-Eustigmatos_ZCMA.PRE.1